MKKDVVTVMDFGSFDDLAVPESRQIGRSTANTVFDLANIRALLESWCLDPELMKKKGKFCLSFLFIMRYNIEKRNEGYYEENHGY